MKDGDKGEGEKGAEQEGEKEGAKHGEKQQALNDIINEETNGGRKPLSGEEADTVLDWANELGIEGARDDRGKGHWDEGEHIHVPGSGIRHIPTEG